jgi:hypothetical protein
MPFTEDHAAFLSTDEFASLVVVDGTDVKGIFDRAYANGSGGANGFVTTQPMVTLATKDVPVSPVGKIVVVNNERFSIEIHEPDGTGVSALMLQKA